MTDYETLCAMYDRAGIAYRIETEGNYYEDVGDFSKAVVTEARDQGVAGYKGFISSHVFDASGNLLSVYNWE